MESIRTGDYEDPSERISAQDVDQARLYAALEQWGVDVSGARERFLEDDGLYIRCLRRFAGEQTMDRLEDAIRRNDLEGAYEMAHLIKGTTGTLNLTPLYDMVCKVTHRLLHNDMEGFEEDYGRMRELYAGFCSLF